METRNRTQIHQRLPIQTKTIHPRQDNQRTHDKIQRNIPIPKNTKRQSKTPNTKPRLLPRQNHRRPIHSNDNSLHQT